MGKGAGDKSALWHTKLDHLSVPLVVASPLCPLVFRRPRSGKVTCTKRIESSSANSVSVSQAAHHLICATIAELGQRQTSIEMPQHYPT